MVYIKMHILLCLHLCAVCEGSAEERREVGVVVMLCLRGAVLNLLGFFSVFLLLLAQKPVPAVATA